MKKINQFYTFTQTSIVTGGDSEALDLEVGAGKPGALALVSSITVDANVAGTFVGATANAVTITAHGYKTGLKGQVSNSGGALPTGLSAVTDYFIIVIDANTVKFASSYANSIVPTPLTISGGTGTNTFTPTALAGSTVKVQWSNDGTVWVSPAAATNVTTTAVFAYEKDRPAWRYIKLTFALTAGSLTVSTKCRSFID